MNSVPAPKSVDTFSEFRFTVTFDILPADSQAVQHSLRQYTTSRLPNGVIIRHTNETGPCFQEERTINSQSSQPYCILLMKATIQQNLTATKPAQRNRVFNIFGVRFCLVCDTCHEHINMGSRRD